MDQRLIDYIKNGLERGYSYEHLRDTLIRHGHDPRFVSNAVDFVRFSSPNRPVQPDPNAEVRSYGAKERKTSAWPIVISGMILVAVISVLFFSLIGQKDEQITGLAVQVEEQQDQQVTTLNALEIQKIQIEAQIGLIQNLNISVADKDAMIKQQREKLDLVNQQIEKERKDTRDMLLEQANSILQREQ